MEQLMYAPPAQPIGVARTPHPQQPTTPAPAVAPAIVQTVSITPVASRTDLLVDVDEWTWQELRDYVVSQIETRFGAFPRDAKKEFGIFSRFLKEHGSDAARIARYVFESCDGWWRGAPVSVNRFTKGSDPYFAAPIKERLAEAHPQV